MQPASRIRSIVYGHHAKFAGPLLPVAAAEYKKQLDTCRTQIKGMESSLATSSKLMKVK